jgi:hypothetical protein
MKGLVLTALLVAASAHGQAASQVNDALGAIRAHDNLLQVSYENLQGMAIGEDKDAVNAIGNTVNTFRIGSGNAIAVGNLLPLMRDPEDAKNVRVQLQYSLGVVLQVADISIKFMNSYMALLKGPAALAETTKARDEMIAIREQIRSLKT